MGRIADGKSAEYIDNINLSSSRDDYVRATPEEEAAVIRKLDFRLLPLVFVLYSLSVLDRSNLGNAKLAGLEDAINLSGERYNWLGTLFYIACELTHKEKEKRKIKGNKRGNKSLPTRTVAFEECLRKAKLMCHRHLVPVDHYWMEDF